MKSDALPPIKTAGGKFYLSDWIHEHAPRRDSYITFVDGMVRSGAVLLGHDPTGKSEIANDKDSVITNFWGVLQTPKYFEQFKRRMEATPFSEIEFHKSRKALNLYTEEIVQIDLEAAIHFFIVARMSRSGDMKEFATITKTRTRRQKNEQVSAWQTSIANLAAVHKRLFDVLLISQDIFELLDEWDKNKTVFIYLDPPYLIEKGGRVTAKLYGKFDWDRAMHERLLIRLVQMRFAKIMLSGYPSDLYAQYLKPEAGWTMYTKEQPLHSAGGDEKRMQTEAIWVNYA